MRRAEITDIAGQQTTKLSGGQSQRVRYALALVPDPDLLVLDEPTVAMDVEVRRAFWTSMREFTDSGRTVLFATHYLEEADDFADRVVVLARGQVVADGTGAQIKATVTGRTISAVVRADAVDLRGPARGGFGGSAGTAVSAALQRFRYRTACPADRFDDARDIEISAGNLEDAFLELTGGRHEPVSRARSAHHEHGPDLHGDLGPFDLPQHQVRHLHAWRCRW